MGRDSVRFTLLVCLIGAGHAAGQSLILTGNLRPAGLRRSDMGRVARDFPLPAMTLFLKRSAAQQAGLEQLLADQRNPGSPRYHRWLTPDDFADRFGASEKDAEAAADWLRSQGFMVGKTARSRTWIVFAGTAGQAEDAFHTEIHRYRLNGEEHFANATELSVPAILANLVSGMDGLDDFALVRPQPRNTSSNGTHTLAPDDLAVIYDIASLYNAGIDGTGQKLVLAGTAPFDTASLADVAQFRASYNLPANVPQIVLDTDYPAPAAGSGDLGEAHLDIEWSGAIARKAQIIYVYSGSYVHAVSYAVDKNLAPVISESANIGCEADNTAATMAFYQGVAQQANAQGITWVNSGNDSGPAACDANGETLPAQYGLSLRFPASVPEVTAVGGLEFNEQNGKYWNATNTANGASATGYIPEMVWNDTAALGLLWAGGGGASIYFAKPAWQRGPGVPNDGARDLPDVALTASLHHDPYMVINGGQMLTNGGTSASSPVFAGMLTLLNHYLTSKGVQAQPGLGNVNPNLYRLASSTTGVFHDITAGNNIVPCLTGSPNCPNGAMGFSAGPGYDQASGLGSVDVANLLSQWNSAPAANSAVGVSVNPNPVYEVNNGWSFTVTLTEEAGVGTKLTGFTIGGGSINLAAFSSTNIPALGSVTAQMKATGTSIPAPQMLAFTGMDASGHTWSQQVSVDFDGPNKALSIGGLANAASYKRIFAPGMLLYVSGTELSPATLLASAVPLPQFMGEVSATINGLAAPLDYVSPGQLNIQIPYEIPTGSATLVINSLGQSDTQTFTVQAAAPGIFTASDGSLVPQSTGARGATLSLFLTGQGVVSPAIGTGAAPANGTPVNQLPSPTLPVSVTVGGVAAPVMFQGIPPDLVGTMQINFQVPETVPLGAQPVVVTVGTVASAPATLTVTN